MSSFYHHEELLCTFITMVYFCDISAVLSEKNDSCFETKPAVRLSCFSIYTYPAVNTWKGAWIKCLRVEFSQANLVSFQFKWKAIQNVDFSFRRLIDNFYILETAKLYFFQSFPLISIAMVKFTSQLYISGWNDSHCSFFGLLVNLGGSQQQPVVSTTFGLVVNFSAGNPCLSNAHRGRADGFKCFWPDGMNPQINWGREGAGWEDLDFSARQNYPQKV